MAGRYPGSCTARGVAALDKQQQAAHPVGTDLRPQTDKLCRATVQLPDRLEQQAGAVFGRTDPHGSQSAWCQCLSNDPDPGSSDVDLSRSPGKAPIATVRERQATHSSQSATPRRQGATALSVSSAQRIRRGQAGHSPWQSRDFHFFTPRSDPLGAPSDADNAIGTGSLQGSADNVAGLSAGRAETRTAVVRNAGGTAGEGDAPGERRQECTTGVPRTHIRQMGRQPRSRIDRRLARTHNKQAIRAIGKVIGALLVIAIDLPRCQAICQDPTGALHAADLHPVRTLRVADRKHPGHRGRQRDHDHCRTCQPTGNSVTEMGSCGDHGKIVTHPFHAIWSIGTGPATDAG